ncbi:MAG: aurora kinase A-interacting protein [Chloroflexi bacterium]|nr:aurora kinase A-interacting protein [Chloroflexota bacterium]
MGSVIKKRRKKINRHKYRKLRKRSRWQRRHK